MKNYAFYPVPACPPLRFGRRAHTEVPHLRDTGVKFPLLNRAIKTTLICTICVIFLNLCNLCFSQDYQWAKSIGNTADDFGMSIAVDGTGNVYVTGHFRDIADFDPGAGTANLTSIGSFDIFFAKYDASGNYLWAKSIGSTIDDYGFSIAVDDAGNVYLTGFFSGTADFNPGAGTANLTSVGSSWDIFFAKYDTAGNYLWAKSIGSTSFDLGRSIAIDGGGNVYVTGYFNGTADFNPGAGIAMLSSVGSSDIFFAKYDAAGNYLWAKSIGSTSSDNGFSIAFDSISNVYLTGYFSGTADFDPGADTANLISVGSNWDIFFAKYDATGNYLWAKNISNAFYNEGRSIDVDDMGNVYVTGNYIDTADFDPGAGTANFISVGQYDIFFAKYDAAGNYLWAKSIGSTTSDVGQCIAVGNTGNVYVIGSFSGTADFDPGAGNANLTPIGIGDIFFAKYDAAGNYLWAKSIGSISSDIGRSIAVDGSGNVYLTGDFRDTADFDPGAGTTNLTSIGGLDIFFAKYSQTQVGINDPGYSVSDQILLYPNPNTGLFTLELVLNEVKEIYIKITNILGQAIYTQKLNGIKGNYQTKIDISSYAKGMYTLKIISNEGVINKKIIIE